MKFILKYTTFLNEAFLQKDKEKAINLIIDFLKKKTEMDFYSYDEIWHIQKDSLFLSGQLWLSLKSDKAIRINWVEGDIRSEIHSIDIWNQFKFDTNPQYTIELGGNSVAKCLTDISSFYKNPQLFIGQSVKEEFTSKEELNKELEDETKKLKRLRNPERIEIQKQKIANLQAKIAAPEKAETESEKINQLDDDLKIEVFKSIELYTRQVATGKSNSLIVTGDSGVGKTQTVIDTLVSLGFKEDVDYYIATGTSTTAALYELLFRFRNKLLVFDDCDDVFKDSDSNNMLKGALDTYQKRSVSKLTKGNTFDSVGMTDEQMEEQFKTSGKYPNKFVFTGQVIFVSNLTEKDFSDALLSRSLHVDVHLNRQELFDRMKDIMKKLVPDVDEDMKLEALEYLAYVCNNYPTKFDLNIRTLIHSINLRANNEEMIQIGDKEEEAWKLLIKKYLIKSRK